MTDNHRHRPAVRRALRVNRNKLRILELLDPDWESTFEDMETAWEHYYEYSPDEIMRFAAEEMIPEQDLM